MDEAQSSHVLSNLTSRHVLSNRVETAVLQFSLVHHACVATKVCTCSFGRHCLSHSCPCCLSAGSWRQDPVAAGGHSSQKCTARLPKPDIPDAECRHVSAQKLSYQQHGGRQLHLCHLQVGSHSSNGDQLRSEQHQVVSCKLHPTCLVPAVLIESLMSHH